ncbi:MAG: nucleotidyltransferase domain-containing protein [bacterium]
MQPTAEQLDTLVQRICDAVHPLRIILFGSAASGEMSADSDIDVAVVVPEGTDHHQTYEQLYPRMVGMGIAIDIIVTTPTQLATHRNSIGLVYRDILRDGKELYAA